MTLMEAIGERHSVRQYTDAPIDPEAISALEKEIQEINMKSGLHVQLVQHEPKAFSTIMAHYGKFSGIENYFAMIGPKGSSLDEEVGW